MHKNIMCSYSYIEHLYSHRIGNRSKKKREKREKKRTRENADGKIKIVSMRHNDSITVLEIRVHCTVVLLYNKDKNTSRMYPYRHHPRRKQREIEASI